MKKLAIPKASEIAKGANRFMKRAGFKLKKHSPEIFIVTGIIGVVATVVSACVATTKLEDVLSESREQIDKIHEVAESDKYVDVYSQEDAKKDLAIVYAKTALKVAKLYAPSVILGALSITSILASHNVLQKRNTALAAAYATVSNGFKDYRKNVVERYGETVDRELKYGIKAKRITEEIIDPKTGEVKTIEKEVKTVEKLDENSQYARFFDELSPYYEKDAELNLAFLRSTQRYANDKLVVNGHLFLNEVYDMLGIPRSKAGQIVGWIYDPDNEVGDNYVDFGIYDVHREGSRQFVNGHERAILLDFNVDGDIWEKMY